MKLSKIALATVVVLGAVVTGGSWYTGKQAEENYLQWVEMANQRLKDLKRDYGIHAEIKNVNIQRHLFSSEMSYNLETQFDNMTDQFLGKGTLYHGPFPLNRLSKGNILPTMASLETTVIVPEPLKEIIKSPELLSANINVGYGETVSGHIIRAGIKSDQFPLELEGVTGNFELDKSGNGNIAFHIPSLHFRNVQSNQQIDVEQSEYNIKLNGKSDYSLLAVGDFDMKAKSYTLSEITPTKADFKLIFNDLTLKGQSKIEQGVYNLEGNYTGKLDIVTHQGHHTLGHLNASSQIALDAKATNTFMVYVNDDEKVQSPKLMNEVISSILTKPLKFHLKNLSLENEKGKSELSLIINSEGVGENKFGNLYQFLTIFKQSKLETKLNISALEEMIKQYHSIRPTQNGNVEALAKNTVNELVYQAKESGLAVVEPENIRLKLEIDQGKVKLNDKDVPEKEVQNALFMLAFGLGGIFK